MEKSREEKKIKISPNEGHALKKGMVYSWKTQKLTPDSIANTAKDICNKVSQYILSDSEESNNDFQEISNTKIRGFLYNTVNVLSNGDIIVIAGAQEIKNKDKFGLLPMFYKLSKSSENWLIESIPMDFESGVDILIDTEEFLHKTWIYLDKIYIIYLSQDNLENSVFVADVSLNKIFRIDLDTKPSIFRTNYSLAGCDNYKLHIFGGVNSEGEALNTLEVFDVAQYQWQNIEMRGNIPSPRQGHSANIINNAMFIFGGTSETDKDNPEQ